MPGVPDLLVCDESGNLHLIELKFTKTNAVELRPHQVSFLSKHKHASTWILVKKWPQKTDDPEIFLFRGSDAVSLRMDGLNKVEPVIVFGKRVDWEKLWGLICPQ